MNSNIFHKNLDTFFQKQNHKNFGETMTKCDQNEVRMYEVWNTITEWSSEWSTQTNWSIFDAFTMKLTEKMGTSRKRTKTIIGNKVEQWTLEHSFETMMKWNNEVEQWNNNANMATNKSEVWGHIACSC